MKTSELEPGKTLDEKDILLADDDSEEALIFEAALEVLGFPYVLRHANNVDTLFVLLKDKLPYILFLDVHMPCKNGVECIREIRKDPAYDKLPVIMYTSNHSPKLADECFSHGANFYFQKGYSLNNLTENLVKVFSIEWDKSLQYPTRDNFILA